MEINLSYMLKKKELEERRGALVERCEAVRRDLQRVHAPVSSNSHEQATEMENDDTLAAIGESAAFEIQQIDEALERLAQGNYGICKSCGRRIESARLAAMPQTIRCVSC